MGDSASESEDFGLGPTSGSAKDGARNKLLELAKRKREEQAAEAAAAETAGPKGGQAAVDFGDSDAEDEAGAIAPEDQQRGVAPVDHGDLFGDEESDEEHPVQATEEDRDFIDDTGVPEDQQIDFGDEEEQQFTKDDEAEEGDLEDELDKLFNKRRRRESQSEHETRQRIDNFLAQMEVAVEEDMKDFEQGRPATHKLRMLAKVTDMLSTQRLHNDMLDAGLLGVLKAWLDPMPDGTLPNSTIRATILKLLDVLPIDCAMEDRKEQLKRSELGKSVMFLAKVSDETPANKRLARNLVEKWSRPILVSRQHRSMDSYEEQQILAARQSRLAAAAPRVENDVDPLGRPVALKPGEPGFRRHAAIPEAAALDYVKQPESRVYVHANKGSGGGDGRGEHRLSKKLKAMGKKSQFGRAANVSVEGRNVTL